MALEKLPPLSASAEEVTSFFNDRFSTEELRAEFHEFIESAIFNEEEMKMENPPVRTLFFSASSAQSAVDNAAGLFAEGYVIAATTQPFDNVSEIEDKTKHCRFLLVEDGKIVDIGYADVMPTNSIH